VISRRLRLTGALGAAVLAVAATGCGGGGGADAAKVKQTVQRALTALADGNGPAFCALATAGAQAELARTTPGASCPDVVTRISRQLSPKVKLALRHARVGTVTITGEVSGGLVTIVVRNPLDPSPGMREGNRLALANIRERLALMYGERALMKSGRFDAEYIVTLRFPLIERTAPAA